MIKKLQTRFIIIAMCAVILVLAVIMGIINVTNYTNAIKSTDEMLDLISKNDGFFPKNNIPTSSGDPNPKFKPQVQRGMSPEEPYQTRFFSVTFNESGEVLAVNTGNIAAVTTDDAEVYAKNILESGKQRGFYDVYRYAVYEKNNGSMVLFLNCSKEFSSVKSFARTSVGVSLIGTICVFLLVFFMSKRAIKPVAESYEKQKRFITDASHELKTPLAVINSNAEVIEMTQGDSEWTHSIKSQVSRLSKLTNELVMLTRMDEDNSKLVMTEFSLSDAVTESLEPYKLLAQSAGKTLEVSVDGNITLNGNEESIRRLIEIFADNSIKYSDDGGTISISLKPSGRGAVLKFRNTVSSIEKGSHDELFERFYRADASRSSSTGGYGIGLSIAKAIVLSHKGKISAASEDGKSLTFTVAL